MSATAAATSRTVLRRRPRFAAVRTVTGGGGSNSSVADPRLCMRRSIWSIVCDIARSREPERVGDALDAFLGGHPDLAGRLLEIGVAEGHQHDQATVVDREVAEGVEQLGVAVLLVLAAERMGAAAQRGELPRLVAYVAERVPVADLRPVAPGPAVGVDGGLEGHVAVAADGVGDPERLGEGGGIEAVELVDASHVQPPRASRRASVQRHDFTGRMKRCPSRLDQRFSGRPF